jgi:phosphoglycerate kinase
MHLSNADLKDKRVFVRADLNCSFTTAGMPQDDTKLQELLPTLELILQKGGTIILATHLGRPKEKEDHLSTRHLLAWFSLQGYQFLFEADLHNWQASTQDNKLILLENLRFFAGEQAQKSAEREVFCKLLAAWADIYVNESFDSLHNNDTSTALLPRFFSPHARLRGLQLAHQLKAITPLLSAKRPFLMIVGGAKAGTKIPYLLACLDKVDHMALCPALVFTVLYSKNSSVGASLVDKSCLKSAFQLAQKGGEKIIYPLDYTVAEKDFSGAVLAEPLTTLTDNAVGIEIGPASRALLKKTIDRAKTIFFNGPMGDLNRPETTRQLKALLIDLGKAEADTFICGGDSVAAVHAFGLQQQFTHCSTGGGVALALLARKRLPGLRFLPE